MHVTLFGVVLFLHIAAAITAFAMAGVMHIALHAVARARTVQELRSWGHVMHRIEPLFPVMALFLLGLGSWLVHLGAHTDDRFSFSTGWILTAMITLVAVEAAGGALLAPRGKRLTAAIEAAPDGPMTDEIRRASTDPVLWDLAHITTVGFLGIVFLMAAKPSGAWAPVFPIAGALVGLALSRAQLRAVTASGTTAQVPAPRTATDVPSEVQA